MDFVCDYCDNVVSVADNQCSVCGALFADVRCPQCEYKGSAKKFANGCPKCKYNNTVSVSSPSRLSIGGVWGFVMIIGSVVLTLMVLVLYNLL